MVIKMRLSFRIVLFLLFHLQVKVIAFDSLKTENLNQEGNGKYDLLHI